ncbi:MAG: aminoacyl-histidine dipeptidase [Bacteroidetes bacterium]|nr:aminoacyl-histidine dipeptidase [Bacteroidota bacterium]
MTEKIEHLKPEPLWRYFLEVCQVPRPSKKEEKIAEYLRNFGKEHEFETITDIAGNVLIRKPASKGKEHLRPVILQSHIDMVGEKNKDVPHNFEKDPIQAYITEGWIKAKGTTLGADDGIGIAATLAIFESKELVHGPLEALFTVDEETGLTGAFGLSPDLLTSKILLNLDSEDEGQIFIGCAGGCDSTATFKLMLENASPDLAPFRIGITGLKGGHSGDDIGKGLGNAVKLLNRFLWNATKMFGIRISTIDAGNLRNAIAREGFANILVPKKVERAFIDYAQLYSNMIKDELRTTETGLAFSLESCPRPKKMLEQTLQNNLLNALYACPHGVIEMSREIHDFVQTSTNLASVKMAKGKIVVTTSQRSSVESAKKDIADCVASVFRLAGAEVEQSTGYPGWKPDTNSEILRLTVNSYKKLFNQEPQVLAIHAGLECGLIGAIYPGMDMVSFGPTIKGAHSPDERLEIESVDKFWFLLIDILKNIPSS